MEREPQPHNFRDRIANSELLVAWDDEFARTATYVDKLGMGLDEAIRPTVTALRLLGFDTIQSCEGHIGWGCPGPWVDIRSPDIPELKQQLTDLVTAAGPPATERAQLTLMTLGYESAAYSVRIWSTSTDELHYGDQQATPEDLEVAQLEMWRFTDFLVDELNGR